MLLHAKQKGRAGFTLLEIIVVISILAVLTTLVAIYVVPAFQDNKNVIRGADRVTTTLLIAKQRALRDQAPRGVRFILNGNNQATQIQFIEQPDAFRSGTIWVQNPGTTVNFSADLVGGGTINEFDTYLVQPGDWLKIEDSTGPDNAGNYQISAVGTLGPSGTPVSVNPAHPFQNASPQPESTFRVIRQARPIAGEAPIDLPLNVVVDVGWVQANSSTNQMQVRQVGMQTYFEILFDPAGSVMDRGGNAPIVLMVRDATQEVPLEARTTQFLTINTRTGHIASHPVGPAGTPLQYALDGRSSGL